MLITMYITLYLLAVIASYVCFRIARWMVIKNWEWTVGDRFIGIIASVLFPPACPVVCIIVGAGVLIYKYSDFDKTVKW